jgi:hypothetical protein
MGFLNHWFKSKEAVPLRLPAGSFTVNPQGNITASTLPRSFPLNSAQEIARAVLTTFRESRDARVALSEFNLSYPGFKISARALGGGALVFLLPRALGQK